MDERVVLLVLGLVALVALGCAVVRIVPAGHHGVVVRAGRPRKTAPSGLVTVVPGLDQLTLLPVQPSTIDPVGVLATTRDGVEVRLSVSVLWQIEDPVLAAQAVPDACTATADAAERALRRHVADVDLMDLLYDRRIVLATVSATAEPLVHPIGVELLDVDLVNADVRVGPELLRLLA